MRRIFMSFSFVVCMLCMAVCLNSCGEDDNEEVVKENGSGEEEQGTPEQEENDDSINVLDKIKDPYLKTYILLNMEKGWIEVADPRVLKPSEAAKVNKLSLVHAANKREMQWLDGIEYFTGLEILYLNGTQIGLIDMSKNLKIKEIHILDSQAESVKIISPSVETIYGKYAYSKSLEVDAPKVTYNVPSSFETFFIESRTNVIKKD